jgi:hypothetical protein
MLINVQERRRYQLRSEHSHELFLVHWLGRPPGLESSDSERQHYTVVRRDDELHRGNLYIAKLSDGSFYADDMAKLHANRLRNLAVRLPGERVLQRHMVGGVQLPCARQCRWGLQPDQSATLPACDILTAGKGQKGPIKPMDLGTAAGEFML